MSGVNKVILVGRLGKDPEMRQAGDNKCTVFSMATSQTWKDKAGVKQEKTSWHNIVTWGKLAEICAEHLKKGRQAYIEGRIDYRTWEDDKGVKKYMTDIIADQVQFLGTGDKASDKGQQNFPDAGGAEDAPL